MDSSNNDMDVSNNDMDVSNNDMDFPEETYNEYYLNYINNFQTKYNINYYCTYSRFQYLVDNKTYNYSESEVKEIKDMCYKQDIKNVFNFNEEVVNSILCELHCIFTNNDIIKLCCLHLEPNNELNGFFQLFSMNYLDLTHKCIIDYFKTGVISVSNAINLHNALMN